MNRTSPFPIFGVVGVHFHFYSISNRYSCKQTVKTLIRCCVLLKRRIRVFTVCLCPKNRTLGLYGLISRANYFRAILEAEGAAKMFGMSIIDHYMGQVMQKTCLMPYVNNKGADLPAHLRSLITTVVVRCLNSTICTKVSRF